jgi:hypothetical protein
MDKAAVKVKQHHTQLVNRLEGFSLATACLISEHLSFLLQRCP